MIESIKFENFKVLKDATLPLSPCTILVGPNGSGKSTVLQALEVVSGKQDPSFDEVVTAGVTSGGNNIVKVRLDFGPPCEGVRCIAKNRGGGNLWARGHDETSVGGAKMPRAVRTMRVYSFDPEAIARPLRARSIDMSLDADGGGLPGVLSQLRDRHEDRFNALTGELGKWLPDFDKITFDQDKHDDNLRTMFLQTRDGPHKIPASALSHGTLIALAILTLVYQTDDPPSLIALEEPDRGLHPYLLRHVQDALHRLAYPESCGEKREPVQVIATTHSPYFLDLFKDYPEEIVIADKRDGNVQFQRLSNLPNIKDILGDEPLGEAWYLGVLGGVPSTP